MPTRHDFLGFALVLASNTAILLLIWAINVWVRR